MFSHSNKTSLSTGKRNAEAAKRVLEEVGINIVGEDLGGSTGRSVELSTRTGTLTIRKRI